MKPNTYLKQLNTTLGEILVFVYDNFPDCVVHPRCGAIWKYAGSQGWNCPHCINKRLDELAGKH